MGLSITPFPTASAREFSGCTTTATAGGATSLTSSSTFVQKYTGSNVGMSVMMPVTTTIPVGFSFLIINDSSVPIAIQSSGGNSLRLQGPGEYVFYICVVASGTGASSWKVIPIPLIDTDVTLAAGSLVSVPAQAAVVSYVATQLANFLATAPIPRYLFAEFDDASTGHTSGIEDGLRSYDIGSGLAFMQGGMLTNPGDTIIQEEVLVTIGSATASRRIKKYLNDSNTNLIWDSGSLTLSLGTRFHIRTTIMRIDETSVRIDVAVTTTSASTVPYVTYTEILTLDGLTSAVENLTTAAIASGVGAAAGDIISVMSHVEKVFGPV